MKKLDIVTGIFSILALIGDLAFMAVLTSLSEASGALSQAATTPDMQDLSSTFSTVLTASWIWAIIVAIACVLGIYMSLVASRKKK